MLNLLIMRHGEAGWNAIDHDRTLTETGRAESAFVARQIAGSPWKPTVIWASPLVRARETAAIVAEVLGCPVVEKDFITPEDDPGVCLDALLEVPAAECPLLVSHMPFVGTLSTLLIDGHRQGMSFITSQAIALELPVTGPGCGELKERFLP